MNTVKPYTDEELREAREHMARCADREFISVVEFRRLLATLDERDRRLAEAMPPRALREWREVLGEHAPEDTGGWSPLVGATHAVVQDLDERTRERDALAEKVSELTTEVAVLCEEVERLRSAVGGEQESAEQQRERAYAAERRAEEAEGRVRVLGAALADLLRHAERNECTHEETERRGHIWEHCLGCGAYWADDRGGRPDYVEPEALTRARDALSTHPPQQQTPAPACMARIEPGVRCVLDAGHEGDHERSRYVVSSEVEVEALRSRVRELEGRLAAMADVVGADDDADPTKWQPGDVVQRLGPAEWTVLDVTKTQMLLGGPPLMPIWRTHEQISADGFRRIHRASTEGRRG